MSCRICSHPFRIRTNPQERGFDYVEGIKIQAGQEPSKELLEKSFSTNMNIPDALEKLEAAAQGKKKLLTELDQLKGLQKLNEKTKFSDADSNADIRARFRKDRKEKRARLQQAKNLGWRDGMEVVGASIEDEVAAKETVFGKSKETEKKRFGAVRQSSIFAAATDDRSGKRKRKRRIKQEEEETEAIFPDYPISRSMVEPLEAPSKPLAEEVAADPPIITQASSSSRIKRKINPSTIGKNAVDISKPSLPVASFSGMLAGYGSDSSSDED